MAARRKPKKKKLTTNQQAYQNQVKRVKQLLRRLEKRGFFLEEEIDFTRPSKVYKRDINRLKSITSKSLAENKSLVYVSRESGEISDALEEMKRQRSEAARKGNETRKRKKKIAASGSGSPGSTEGSSPEETRSGSSGSIEPGGVYYDEDGTFLDNVILTNFYNAIESYPYSNFTEKMSALMHRLVKEQGLHAMATVLEEMAGEGIRIDYEVMYSEERNRAYLAALLDRLDINIITRHDLEDAYEYNEF